VKVRSQQQAAELAGTDTVLQARVLEPEGRGWWRVDIGVPALLRRQGQRGPGEDLAGQDVECTVVRTVPERDMVLVSPLVSATERDLDEHRRNTLRRLTIGDVRPGRVRSIAPFGAFVEIEDIYGLVHVSEIGDRRTDVGDEVQVEILDTDVPLQRVSLRLVNSA
jgi:ribosomal protein S1